MRGEGRGNAGAKSIHGHRGRCKDMIPFLVYNYEKANQRSDWYQIATVNGILLLRDLECT